MADSIKLFQFIQKLHQILGIQPVQSNQKQRQTKTVLLICYTQYIFTTVAFLTFEAESIFEYGFACYMLLSIINAATIYLIFISQSQIQFDFIGNCEAFIKKRE